MKTIVKITWFLSFCAICWLSLSPAPNATPTIQHLDKVHHALAYCWLCSLAKNVLHDRNQFRWAVAFCLLLGGILELLQSFCPTRTASVMDMVANTLGTGIGCLLPRCIKR